MPAACVGQLFRGQSAVGEPVCVELVADGLRITQAADASVFVHDRLDLYWARPELRVEAGGEMVTHIDGGSLTFTAEAARDVAEWHRAKKTRLLKEWLTRPGPAVFLIAVAVCLLAGWTYAADRVARALATRVSWETERRLTQTGLDGLASYTCGAQGQQAILEGLAHRLAHATQGALERPVVRIIDTDSVNAYTLPGGIILVESNLLQDAESGDEIAGVLAHEIGHLAARDTTAGLIRSALSTALFRAALGDLTGLLVLDPTTLWRVTSLKFGREAEMRADETMLRILAREHVSTAGVAAFFNRQQHGEHSSIFTTHPGDAERAARARAQQEAASVPAMSEDDFREVRAGCTKTLAL